MTSINLRLLKRSFSHAIDGLRYIFFHEQNFRIQVIVGLIVFVLAFCFPISLNQKITIILLIGLVLILELLNSAIERTVDLLKPRIDPTAETVKKIMSGLVFIAVLVAVIISILIFYPFVF